jgi:hypothetical protein
MAEQKRLAVMRERVDGSSALQSIHVLRGDVAGVVEQKLVYPYFRFKASCKIPTMIGKQHVTVDCLVDGINGLGATADPFITDQLLATDENHLKPDISRDEAVKIAQRTVTHQLGKKLKMIAPFDVTLEAQGMIYRSFWIVRIGDSRIMVDSVTGGIQPLSASAA